jgi:DNA-binding XRE family transcriptional regulator
MRNRMAKLRTAQGWSQAELAERLTISRQTVIAIERSKTDPGLGLAMRIAWLFGMPIESIFVPELEEKMTAIRARWEYKDCAATALDEISVLRQMGQEGWEMIGFGAYVLNFRRPEDVDLRIRWQYERLTGLLLRAKRNALEDQDWIYCGSWIGVFHYFKREEQQETGNAKGKESEPQIR